MSVSKLARRFEELRSQFDGIESAKKPLQGSFPGYSVDENALLGWEIKAINLLQMACWLIRLRNELQKSAGAAGLPIELRKSCFSLAQFLTQRVRRLHDVCGAVGTYEFCAYQVAAAMIAGGALETTSAVSDLGR